MPNFFWFVILLILIGTVIAARVFDQPAEFKFFRAALAFYIGASAAVMLTNFLFP